MRRAERLFRLVNELRSRGVCRAEDLARHFEISVRTVYRDIGHLQGSGLPIDGEPGVGYLLRPGFDLPAMTFSFEQIDALAIGLSFVEAAGDSALSHAAAEARAKLQAALPDGDTRALMDAPMFASRRDGRAAPIAKNIRAAIRNGRKLELEYVSEPQKVTRRRVRPLALWAFSNGWLFIAWCELRQDFRAFRIDRIEAIVETDEQFAPEAGTRLADYLERKFGGVTNARRPV